MPDDPAPLPDLPDFDSLVEAAKTRRAHFIQIRNAAQSEVDTAEKYLAKLTGKGRSRAAPGTAQKPVSESTLRAVMNVLAQHRYARVSTLTASGASHTTVGYAMIEAVKRELAEREKRGRHYRYAITEKGQEYVTDPEQP